MTTETTTTTTTQCYGGSYTDNYRACTFCFSPAVWVSVSVWESYCEDHIHLATGGVWITN